MNRQTSYDEPEDASPLVLIVDDEEPMVELLSYVVADAGYVPVTAAHGREALDLARERWPDLIITDLMMPYASGADLIAAMRAEAEATGLPPVRVILLTGAGRDAALAAGADIVLHKPFELADIDAVLRSFLEPSTANGSKAVSPLGGEAVTSPGGEVPNAAQTRSE
jgi:DNA-binding response OmpR family regulator